VVARPKAPDTNEIDKNDAENEEIHHRGFTKKT
jgi:hypothetical protein